MADDARLLAAQAHERAGNTNAARAAYAQAAQAGDLRALTALAKSLLVREPLDIGNGIGMIRTAADRGDREACALCAVLAGQDDQLPDRWRIARDYLARSGDAKLTTLLGTVDLAAWTKAPSARVQFETPRVLCIENFASSAFCDWLIERARPRMRAATVYDPATGTGQRRDDIRSNSAVAFDITQFDLALVAIRARIAALANVRSEAFEPPMVLHYTPGQQFAPHFDYIEPATPGLANDVARNGQRIGTFLLYLSDGFDGGETDFPELGWKFKGGKGDALLFWSADANGALDRRTLHAGAPVTSGEKWVLSQWIRRR
jgi:prolyl 4-hydroxylase